MVLNYKVCFKDGIFKYDCTQHSSYLEISAKDIKKIYDILNLLDVIYELVKKTDKNSIVYGGFTIIFDDYRFARILNASNWLSIEEEVPIIKRELRKYIQKYNIESTKDIIVKIKSLKKGSGNIIKED